MPRMPVAAEIAIWQMLAPNRLRHTSRPERKTT